MTSVKERKIDKIFSTWVTVASLVLMFAITLFCIKIIPQLFVAFVAAFCFFVVYVFYAHAKNKHEVKSGVYDSLIFHDEERTNNDLK